MVRHVAFLTRLLSLLGLALGGSSTAGAQDLTGVWFGQQTNGVIQLVIVQKGDSCFGYVFERSMGECTANFEGRFHSAKQQLTGSSPSFIRKTFGHGLGRYSFTYDTLTGRERLVGTVRAKSTAAAIMSFGMAVRCTLYRTKDLPDTTTFMAQRLKQGFSNPGPSAQTVAAVVVDTSVTFIADTAATASLQKVQSRPAQTLQTIQAPEGLVRCTLYDNGSYDHDTVTIVHNGKVVLNRVEVSAKPLRFDIRVSRDEPEHEIVFFANNLGDIPPNTGLLILEAGDKRYSIQLTADLLSNGKVIVKALIP